MRTPNGSIQQERGITQRYSSEQVQVDNDGPLLSQPSFTAGSQISQILGVKIFLNCPSDMKLDWFDQKRMQIRYSALLLLFVVFS